MMRLGFLALLVVCASAVPQLLISTESNLVIDGEVEVHVTSSTCLTSLGDLAASSSEGTVNFSQSCVATLGNQAYVCTLSNLSPLPTSGHETISVIVPVGAAVDSSGSNNSPSNPIDFHAHGIITSDVAPGAVTPFGDFSYKVDFSITFGSEVYPSATDVNSLFTLTPSGVVSADALIISGPMNWAVSVMAPTGTEFVRLTINTGAGVDILGAQSESSTGAANVEGTVPPNEVNCVVSRWAEWSACSGSCTSYNDIFEPSTGFFSRDRAVITSPSANGQSCPPLSQTEPCPGLPLCFTGSRPFSGEGAPDCEGSASAGSNCGPTDGIFIGGVLKERNGCACDFQCEGRGDCCQAYYTKNCCDGGNCAATNADRVYPFVLHTCLSSQCNSANLIRPVQGNDSYYCYCDAQCRQDGQCCGGQVSRDAVCL